MTRNKINRKTELNSIIDKSRTELWEIEKTEKIKQNQKYIGKFYKYHNCYSCPKKDEYWWYYVCVTGIDDDGEFISWGFEKDIYGKINIELKNSAYSSLEDRYIKISKEKFYLAYSILVNELMEKLNETRIYTGI